jgi:hypothetical protein
MVSILKWRVCVFGFSILGLVSLRAQQVVMIEQRPLQTLEMILADARSLLEEPVKPQTELSLLSFVSHSMGGALIGYGSIRALQKWQRGELTASALKTSWDDMSNYWDSMSKERQLFSCVGIGFSCFIAYVYALALLLASRVPKVPKAQGDALWLQIRAFTLAGELNARTAQECEEVLDRLKNVSLKTEIGESIIKHRLAIGLVNVVESAKARIDKLKQEAIKG